MFRRVFFVCSVLGCQSVAAAAAPVPEHRLRRVQLREEAGGIHALAVVGAPHVTTTLRLPDSFSAANVACGGDCIDAQALDGGQQGTAGANWVLDLRPKERTLHLWPAALPSRDNPPSAFRSNIYVGLDGGDVINVALQLVDPARPGAQADAVVDVVGGSNAATFSGRLEAERQQAQKRAAAQAVAEVQDQLRQQLGHGTQCRQVRWSRPHRHERVVVRLRQICATAGVNSLRWVVFAVENRGSDALQLGAVRLSPDEEEAGEGFIDRGASTNVAVLEPGADTQGVAAVQLVGDALDRRSWTLWLEAQPPRHEQVRIGRIRF